MSLIFSRGCEYALQAVIYLAAHPQNTPIFQREISAALNIPPHFLGKILQLLTRNGIVISRKGKTGGFILGRSPKEISPFDIIVAIDGPAVLDGCMLGFPGCGDDSPCPVHSYWKKSKDIIVDALHNKNIEELGRELHPKLELIKISKNGK